jgi:hypothetical protein
MPKHLFQPGNTLGRLGRPKGSRNVLDAFAYACALAHVQHNLKEPAPADYAQTNLWKALDVTLRQNPSEYVRRITSMLPKEVSLQHTTARELSDEELGNVIEGVRTRLLEAREERALNQAAQIKLVEHAR